MKRTGSVRRGIAGKQATDVNHSTVGGIEPAPECVRGVLGEADLGHFDVAQIRQIGTAAGVGMVAREHATQQLRGSRADVEPAAQRRRAIPGERTRFEDRGYAHERDAAAVGVASGTVRVSAGNGQSVDYGPVIGHRKDVVEVVLHVGEVVAVVAVQVAAEHGRKSERIAVFFERFASGEQLRIAAGEATEDGDRFVDHE